MASASTLKANTSEQKSQPELLVVQENQFALAALQLLCDQEVIDHGDIVYLWGRSGVGKTRLASQVVEDFQLSFPEGVVFRGSTEQLSNDQIEIRKRLTNQHPTTQKGAPLLWICEDLHHLQRKPSLQAIFEHLLDLAIGSQVAILVTAQSPPGELKEVGRRIVNRLHASTIAEVGFPGVPSRRGYLRHFAKSLGLALNEPILERLAAELIAGPRELMGALQQLQAIARFESSPISMQTVDLYFSQHEQLFQLDLPGLVRMVSHAFGVSQKSLRSQTRQRSPLIARQAAMLLAREELQLSLVEIGSFFNGKSHSTVLNSCRSLQKMLEKDAAIQATYNKVRRQIHGIPVKAK